MRRFVVLIVLQNSTGSRGWLGHDEVVEDPRNAKQLLTQEAAEEIGQQFRDLLAPARIEMSVVVEGYEFD